MINIHMIYLPKFTCFLVAKLNISEKTIKQKKLKSSTFIMSIK